MSAWICPDDLATGLADAIRAQSRRHGHRADAARIAIAFSWARRSGIQPARRRRARHRGRASRRTASVTDLLLLMIDGDIGKTLRTAAARGARSCRAAGLDRRRAAAGPGFRRRRRADLAAGRRAGGHQVAAVFVIESAPHVQRQGSMRMKNRCPIKRKPRYGIDPYLDWVEQRRPAGRRGLRHRPVHGRNRALGRATA